MKVEDFKNNAYRKQINISRLKLTLKKEALTIEEIADRFDVPVPNVVNCIEELRKNSVMFSYIDGKYSINETPIEGGRKVLNPDMWRGDKIRFGFTADNHLCSNFARQDVLELIYDICAGEGVDTVLNGGNWIDGEARFNKNEIHVFGFENQISFCAENYPYREGIKTLFVSGDDHEGWYNQREGINSGKHLQQRREELGMFDMEHLGYVEADIDLNEGEFKEGQWLRLMHAGGGSSYATSYAAQKIIESFQGGEKPSVLMIGHYHKLMYAYIRGVHAVQMGTTQDQSIFMRKKKIEAHVGGGIVEFTRNKDGIIKRCNVEFITAFDKKFYKGKDKYWKSK